MLGDDILAAAMKQIIEGPADDIGEAARQYNKRALQIEEIDAERQAAIVRRALDNDAGRAFLVWLTKKTVFRGASPAEQAATTAEMFAIEKAKREGQASVLFLLLDVLAWERPLGDRASGE